MSGSAFMGDLTNPFSMTALLDKNILLQILASAALDVATVDRRMPATTQAMGVCLDALIFSISFSRQTTQSRKPWLALKYFSRTSNRRCFHLCQKSRRVI